MTKKIIEIIKKNFKILARSKSSALIVVLGPLILITLVGLAFSNTGQYFLTVSTYSQSYSGLTNSLTDKLSENNILVTKADSEDICVDNVKRSETNMCIIFPPDMVIKQDAITDVVFYVDYSKINLVWSILDIISSKIGEKSQEISTDLTSDLLSKISYAEDEIGKRVPAIVAITTENTDSNERVSKVITSLGSLDLEIDANDFRAGSIRNAYSTSYEEMQAFVQKTYDTLADIDSMLAGLPGNTSGIDYEIATARESLDDSYGVIRNNDNNMADLLDSLDVSIAKTQEKLEKASIARATTGADLNIVNRNLAASEIKLNQLQTSLNSIRQNILGIEIRNATKIVNPITTTIKPVATTKTNFNYLFPTLVVLVIMITSVLLGSTLVMVEKKSKSFFRNFISPTSRYTFMGATYTTALIIMSVQILIFLIISFVFFNTKVESSVLTTMFILMFITSFFIMLGMCIGTIFKSEETTALASITISSILLFFSSTIIPLEGMPIVFKKIASFNPFVVSDSLLRESLFFSFSFDAIDTGLYIIVFYIAIAIVGIIAAQNYARDHVLFKVKTEHIDIIKSLNIFNKKEEHTAEEKAQEHRKEELEDELKKLKRELKELK